MSSRCSRVLAPAKKRRLLLRARGASVFFPLGAVDVKDLRGEGDPSFGRAGAGSGSARDVRKG